MLNQVHCCRFASRIPIESRQIREVPEIGAPFRNPGDMMRRAKPFFPCPANVHMRISRNRGSQILVKCSPCVSIQIRTKKGPTILRSFHLVACRCISSRLSWRCLLVTCGTELSGRLPHVQGARGVQGPPF